MKDIMNKIRVLIRKHEEAIPYLIFGILTTIVNIIAYFILLELFNINYLISNIIAWFVSVLFAYITNRKWVFKSKNDNILLEMNLFFGSRLLSGIIDSGLMILFINFMAISDVISKFIVQIIVIIANYILSKWVIFKKRN
jgi:putative flippase GtrA